MRWQKAESCVARQQNAALTRIWTGVAAATMNRTNHYTTTGNLLGSWSSCSLAEWLRRWTRIPLGYPSAVRILPTSCLEKCLWLFFSPLASIFSPSLHRTSKPLAIFGAINQWFPVVVQWLVLCIVAAATLVRIWVKAAFCCRAAGTWLCFLPPHPTAGFCVWSSLESCAAFLQPRQLAGCRQKYSRKIMGSAHVQPISCPSCLGCRKAAQDSSELQTQNPAEEWGGKIQRNVPQRPTSKSCLDPATNLGCCSHNA